MQLINTLVKYDKCTDRDEKTNVKLELVQITSALMPKGLPSFIDTVKFPTIEKLIDTEGKGTIIKAILVMIKDYCSSVNVVRNMNEDQMIEAAAMLVDECGNFRLEDYYIMFAMGKRNQFTTVKLMDRVDIQLISAMLEEFWETRNRAGKRHMEEVQWMPPANPVPVEKVNEVWDQFYCDLQDEIMKDATINDQKSMNVTRKTLDEVLSDLRGILPPPKK